MIKTRRSFLETIGSGESKIQELNFENELLGFDI